jgi:hypothetical protein
MGGSRALGLGEVTRYWTDTLVRHEVRQRERGTQAEGFYTVSTVHFLYITNNIHQQLKKAMWEHFFM